VTFLKLNTLPRSKPPRKKRSKPRAVHSERSGLEHKRIRLYGAARAKRREEIFARAGGKCEDLVPYRRFWFNGEIEYGRCNNRATEWSHARHAANKCDCLDPKCSIASCKDCHDKRHNPKACPKAEWRKKQ